MLDSKVHVRERAQASAHHCSVAVAVALTMLGGCGTVESGSRSAPEIARSADRDGRDATDADVRAQPSRGRIIGGERVRRTIAWPDAARIDTTLRTRYAATVRDTLDRSPVPVLAPAEPGERVTASTGERWYAITVHGDGYLMHTHGSGEAHVLPHVRSVDPTHPMREAGGFLTRNEDIWAATWIEYGVAYSFDIECDRRQVSWCDDEAEVTSRIEALTLVATRGGAR